MLLRSFLGEERKDEALVLAGPVEKSDPFTNELLTSTQGREKDVVWTGMLEGDLKWGVLRAADALVLPSHQENYGMVVAEALSVGTPVLLTDKVNLWREVKQARVAVPTGLLSCWVNQARPGGGRELENYHTPGCISSRSRFAGRSHREGMGILGPGIFQERA